MKTSVFGRTFDILKLATKVSVKELKRDKIEMRFEQAQLIVQQLGQLKGAAMKVGQMLSLDAADYFPPEAVAVLEKLQSSAPPYPTEELFELAKLELGEKFSDFKNITPHPVASASIGQVYQAEVDGKKVAIKIQYPGIRDSIESDLSAIKNIARIAMRAVGKDVDLREFIAELKTVLLNESNYLREAEMGLKYKGLVDKSDLRDRLLISTPLIKYCSQSVLTTEWISGHRLSDWIKTHPSEKQREDLGHLVLELYCKEFFEWGLVQTDPNFGNFLIKTEGEKVILGCIDFGATIEYDDTFRSQYIKLLQAIGTKDDKIIRKACNEFGLIDEREGEESYRLFNEMLIHSIIPFEGQVDHGGKFYFKDSSYNVKAKQLAQSFTKSLKYSPPPKSFLFLHRKLDGLFKMIKQLDVKLDLAHYWFRMTGQNIKTSKK